jgi:DNA-binding PadR family transcriptional regulator
MLNSLEKKGFLASEKQQQGGRARKVYTITEEGQKYLRVYFAVIREQLEA